jgi:hypothetical protein
MNDDQEQCITIWRNTGYGSLIVRVHVLAPMVVVSYIGFVLIVDNGE